MCLVNCPFAAIADKSQIFQIINNMKRGREIYACVAPAFVGQFGKNVSSAQLKTAMRQLGFVDVVEVAIGADLCTIEESRDFLEKVPARQPFMGTSCCPAWSVMAKKLFPEFKDYISMGADTHGHHRPNGQEGPPGCADLLHRPPARRKSWRRTGAPSAPTWTMC